MSNAASAHGPVFAGHQYSAQMIDQYRSIKSSGDVVVAARPKSTIFSGEKIISALLGVMIALTSVIYLNLKSDIDELKKDSKDLVKQASDTRVDLVRAIGAVEKQAAATNARLDQLITDGRQRR
jgi:hypothetical protein